MSELLSGSSPNLALVHPTKEEKVATWKLNYKNWGSALSQNDYVDREAHLEDIPATRNGGVTHWLLTDPSLPAESRPLLSSCETLRRRALFSSPESPTPKETITHGIGSVFCPPEHRGRGYASRMLSLLGPQLKTWQKEIGECNFSVLYSDIGKKYYAGLGWPVFPSSHISLPPMALQYEPVIVNGTSTSVSKKEAGATRLYDSDLPALCALDEKYIYAEVEQITKSTGKPTVAIIPDYLTMEWHHLRQAFMCTKLFGRAPDTKGVISSGTPGNRIWIITSLGFYGAIGDPKSGNTLYVLRLVVEDENDTDENAQKLKSVLEIAQSEAHVWGVNAVEMWNTSSLVKALLRRSGLDHVEKHRDSESITSLMWYGEGKGGEENVNWAINEKFGWC